MDLSSDGSLNDQEFEALTYLPNTHGNNYFIVGSQTDGNIYKFHLEMLDSQKVKTQTCVSSQSKRALKTSQVFTTTKG